MAQGAIRDQRQTGLRSDCFVEGDLLLPALQGSAIGFETTLERTCGDTQEVRMQAIACFTEEGRMEDQSQESLSSLQAGRIASAAKMAPTQAGLLSSGSSFFPGSSE